MGVSDVRGVTGQAVDNEAADGLLGAFLDMLAWDIAARPEALVPLGDAFFARIAALTQGVIADPDDPIEGAVGL